MSRGAIDIWWTDYKNWSGSGSSQYMICLVISLSHWQLIYRIWNRKYDSNISTFCRKLIGCNPVSVSTEFQDEIMKNVCLINFWAMISSRFAREIDSSALIRSSSFARVYFTYMAKIPRAKFNPPWESWHLRLLLWYRFSSHINHGTAWCGKHWSTWSRITTGWNFTFKNGCWIQRYEMISRLWLYYYRNIYIIKVRLRCT